MKQFLDRYKTGFQLQDWQKTGLLSSLAPDQEPQMVEIFEKAMPYILSEKDQVKIQLILPILRRVYTELVTSKYSNDQNKMLLYLLIDVDDVLQHFNQLYDNVLPSFYGFKYIDPEAEFCSTVTRDYIGKLNKQINKDINTLLPTLISLSRDRKINKIL